MVVFKVIKENCNTEGGPNEECVAALEKLVDDRQLFFPPGLYLEVLQGLGLIKIRNGGKEIILTEKGYHTNYYSLFGFRIFMLSVFYLARYLLLLILFWPLLVLMPKPNGGEHHKKNSAG